MSTTVRTLELLRILRNAAVFASTDDTLPILCAVRLTWGEGKITAVATDRYVLGQDSAELADGSDGSGVALIAVRDLKPLITASRGDKYGFMTVTAEGDKVTFASTYGVTHVIGTAFGQWPDTDRYIPEPGDSDEHDPRHAVTFNPQYLAKFGKVDGGHKSAPMRLAFAGRWDGIKPVHVTIGDTFVGAIMPIKAEARRPVARAA